MPFPPLVLSSVKTVVKIFQTVFFLVFIVLTLCLTILTIFSPQNLLSVTRNVLEKLSIMSTEGSNQGSPGETLLTL